MSNYIVSDTDMTSVADAIRTKGNTNQQLEFPTGFVSAIGSIPSGGGAVVTEKDVNFIDYDGTILHSYTAQEFASLTSLPENPSHPGLTAQGWNWTLAQISAQLTAVPNSKVWVGQMYVTTSGDTEIDITLDNPDRLSPYLAIAVNGTVSVDWGDNSATSVVTGDSLLTLTYTLHTYSSTGNYTIKISVTNGSFAFYCANSNGVASVLTAYDSSGANRLYDKTYTCAIKNIRMGTNASIWNYAFTGCCSLQSITIPSGVTIIKDSAFSGCYSLRSITIPSGVTSIGQNVFSGCCSLQSITIPSGVTNIGIGSTFYNCYSLQSITIPSGVTSISGNTFYNCYSLQSITIPSGVTSINDSAFFNCQSLQSIAIPSGVTSIWDRAFYGCVALQSITIPSGVTIIRDGTFSVCQSLQSITIPSGVTSIGSDAFSYCYATSEYHFQRTTPPTITNRTFNGIIPGTIIYVPSAALEDYKTASAAWSAYASYLQGE